MTKSMTTNHVFEGVPTFFRACCYEASRGGKDSYQWAGYHLAHATGGLAPYSATNEAWAAQVEELVEMASQEDRPGIWDWYKRTYPECMKLIPSKRKSVFVKGVLYANEEEPICV